jgi:hypothetical protein
MVAAAGLVGSTPQEVRHRRLLQLRWWPLLDTLAAPHMGPAIDVFFNIGGGHSRTRW